GRYRLSRRSALGLFAIRLLAALANVDAALKERAVLDADARRHYIAGERAIAANVDPVARGQVAAHFAEHHDFARIDIGGDDSVAANGYAVASQVDGAFHAAVNVKGLRTGHLTLDHQRFADRRLIRRARGYRTRRRGGFARGRLRRCSHGRTLWLRRAWPGRGRRLICGLSPGAKILPFVIKGQVRISLTRRILLSDQVFVLWKIGLSAAFGRFLGLG